MTVHLFVVIQIYNLFSSFLLFNTYYHSKCRMNHIKEVDLPAVGPKLENHPLFPERTNVEFVEILPDQSLRMRVWERGSGITMACGTGACATAVAAVLNHKAGRKSWVRMDGGDLHIHWDEKDGHVYMTGPAGKVFEGEIEM